MSKASSIILMDQHVGTGFTYSDDIRDKNHNEKGVSDDMYHFCRFLFKAHPDFAGNNFFVIGESYAGHYVLVVTSQHIHKANKANKGLQISLKGFAINNGL
ncbi:hypothetical protein L7F22_056898 [Adiantum nelumboides]|nr:hypothetical protein [Adiantum nelumboides]